MDVVEALKIVKKALTIERYEHTERVVDTARKLANIYNEDMEKAEIAAALHDYAKYRDPNELKRWILREKGLPKDLLQYHHELWHGPVGAYLLRVEHDVTTTSILDAITYHTTGRANMTTLDKIIFLADYIEPGRNFPGLEEVRNEAWKDLDKGCYLALKNTIMFLMNKNQPIYPNTFQAYNDLNKRIKE